LISFRTFRHPESHGKQSMAFLFPEEKMAFTAEIAAYIESRDKIPTKPDLFDFPVRSLPALRLSLLLKSFDRICGYLRK